MDFIKHLGKEAQALAAHSVLRASPETGWSYRTLGSAPGWSLHLNRISSSSVSALQLEKQCSCRLDAHGSSKVRVPEGWSPAGQGGGSGV